MIKNTVSSILKIAKNKLGRITKTNQLPIIIKNLFRSNIRYLSRLFFTIFLNSDFFKSSIFP